MKKIALPLIVLVLISGLAETQEQKSEQKGAMPKPKFGPELAKLAFLVGNFSTENIAYDTPMGKGGPGKGRNMNRWDLDSMYVIVNYQGEIATMGHYEGHGMITFDWQSSQYKCWWFDNYGNHSEYTGSFTGDTLSMEGGFATPAGNVKERIMWHPEGKKFKFLTTWDMGQGPMPVMAETATPSGAKTRPKK